MNNLTIHSPAELANKLDNLPRTTLAELSALLTSVQNRGSMTNPDIEIRLKIIQEMRAWVNLSKKEAKKWGKAVIIDPG